MLKERRWCLRKNVSLNADIIYNDQSDILHCKICNLGLEGIFIETDHACMEEKTPVQVMFKLDSDSGLKPPQIHAKVIHSNDQGAGLAFRNHDMDTIRFMRELFYMHT